MYLLSHFCKATKKTSLFLQRGFKWIDATENGSYSVPLNIRQTNIASIAPKTGAVR